MSTYIKRRGNAYFFRLFIPPRFRHLCGGRSEIVKALGTTDLYIARRRATIWRARAEHLIELMSQGHTLTSEQIELELQRIVEAKLEGFRGAEMSGLLPLDPADPEETPAELATSFAADYWQDYQDGVYSRVRNQVEDIQRRANISIDPESPLYHELCKGLLYAHAEIYRVQAKRLRGDIHAVPRRPLNPALTGPNGAAKGLAGPKFGEATEAFLEGLARSGKRGSTVAKHRATFKAFLDIVGDLPVGLYTRRSHITPFFDVLKELPPKYDKQPRWRGLSTREIAAKNKAGGGSRLSDKTLLNHQGHLGGFFDYLKKRGEYEGENPARGLFSKRDARSGVRELWYGERLKRLFESPVWTGCKSESRRAQPGMIIVRDHYYWIPLLSLYQGARMEELAQLRVKHVRSGDGVWYINITDEDGGHLKSPAAKRRLPLHEAILALGFVEQFGFIADKDALIFPELRPGGPDKKLGFYFSKQFTAYRKAIGLYEPLLDFHSLRHGVATKLADVPSSVRNSITGHEGSEMADKVYTHREHIPLTTLREAINKVQWPEVDVEALAAVAKVGSGS